MAIERSSGAGSSVRHLSPRRQEVVNLLFQGCTNEQIAEAMGVCRGRVTKHIRALFMQTGTESRLELICKLRETDVLTIPPQWELSPSQAQVALLVAQGMSNKEIAEHLGRTLSSVMNSVVAVFDKAGVWSRLQLALRIRDMQVTQ